MIVEVEKPATKALDVDSVGFIGSAAESLGANATVSGSDILVTALVIAAVVLSGVLVLYARRI
ncbi:MAG: hypothetical protein VCD00_05595 [Candidatus Hydrogenedentota bacterium]